MNEYEFRRLLLAALGSTGNFQNEVEFRISLAAAMAGVTTKTKPAIVALTGSSTAADIVAALKA